MEEKNVQEENIQESPKANSSKKGKIIFFMLTAILSVVLLAFYQISTMFAFFPIVLSVYIIVLPVLVLVYIFYNRGFSRRGVTVDMLPETWGEQKKQDYVNNANLRLKRSRWMLSVILAILVTFFVDAIMLFVISPWI